MKGIILAVLAAVTLAGCIAVPVYPEASYYPGPAYYPAPAVGVVGVYPGRGYYGYGHRHWR
jgi:hypothetical protein